MKHSLTKSILGHLNLLPWFGCIRSYTQVFCRDERRDFLEFSRKNKSLLAENLVDHSNKNALIVSHGFVAAAKLEGLICKSLQLQGVKPIVLFLEPSYWPRKYLRLYGVQSFLALRDFTRRADRAVADDIVSDFFREKPGFPSLLNFCFKSVHVGRHVLSLIVRKTHAGELDFSDESLLSEFRRGFVTAISSILAADRLFASENFILSFFNERGYTPYGEVFDCSLLKEINTIQYVGSHSNNSFHFKRYTLDSRLHHPISLAEQSWDSVKAMSISDEILDEFVESHWSMYETGNWYARQELQKSSQIMSDEETRKKLRLRAGTKTAVIFSQVLWDATFFYGEGLFPDYAQWLIETIRSACRNNKLQWVVKLHPANLWRLRADGYSGELAELKLIKKHIGTLPSHVTVLLPETEVSTASLFRIADYCLTVRGTIGMEMPMFGVPVITAGTGRYSGLGFTVDSCTKQDYQDLLGRLESVERLNSAQIRLARLFAYSIFKLRPFPFSKVHFTYDSTRKATLSPAIEFDFKNSEELRSSKELLALGSSLLNPDVVDFFHSSRIQSLERVGGANLGA
jgi:hypothetical protein